MFIIFYHNFIINYETSVCEDTEDECEESDDSDSDIVPIKKVALVFHLKQIVTAILNQKRMKVLTPPLLKSFDGVPGVALIQECPESMVDPAELFFDTDPTSTLPEETHTDKDCCRCSSGGYSARSASYFG